MTFAFLPSLSHREAWRTYSTRQFSLPLNLLRPNPRSAASFCRNTSSGWCTYSIKKGRKKKHGGLRLVGLGFGVEKSYNWEKSWEHNGKSGEKKKKNCDTGGIWRQKRYWKQINAHCAFLNVSRTAEKKIENPGTINAPTKQRVYQ